MTWASFLRFSPLLFLAVALMALAVFFVHDSQPVAAQAPGVPRPEQTQLMHLGFYLWWEESSGASGYDIQIRSQSGGAWGQWSAVSYSGTTQPAIVTGLTHLTKYQWRIRATAGGRQSAWSTILGDTRDTRTATKFSIHKPNPPILHAAVPGPGCVTLRWEAGPTSGRRSVVDGYRIRYRWEDGQGVTTTRSTGPFSPDVTSADVTGLSAGVVYDFWVRPLVDGVAGASSRLLQATPTAPSDPVIQFGSATYSGTEGDTITIRLSLAEAQCKPFRVWVRADPRSDADYESDFSFGDCLPDEASCDFGIGVLDVTIPAGDTTYDYDIRIVDDHRVEGSESFTLDFAYVGSPYVLGDNSQAVITIEDNDEAGVAVSTKTVSMDEETTGNEEADATYTIRLDSQPDDWVRVYPESAFSCKVGVIRGFVEFSRHNWDQPQTVRLRAEHDFDAVDEKVVISHRVEAASASAEYRTVTVPSVTVNVDDKHSPALMVEKSSLAPVAGETVQYRVYLSADPAPIFGENPVDCYDYSSSHTVIVQAASSDTNKVTVSPASVTFTADDYDPKTIYVTGVSAGDVTITHAVSGTDPAYTSTPLVLQNVAVSVPAQQQSAPEPPSSPQEDTEPEPLRLPGPVLEVQLAATSDSLTVRWNAPETGDPPTRYIVHIAPVGGGKGELKTPKAKKTSVTFRGLEAGGTYRIFVRAKNKEGKGPRVRAIVTLPEAPSG